MTQSTTTSPYVAVFKFINAYARDRDLRAAWPHVDPLLRLCWAQMWAEPLRGQLRTHGYDPDSVVNDLSHEVSTHAFWPQFVRDVLAFTSPPNNMHKWNSTTDPRPIAPDIELVQVFPAPDNGRDYIKPGERIPAVPFVMRFSEGRWRVLNFFGERIPEPGWPPKLN